MIKKKIKPVTNVTIFVCANASTYERFFENNCQCACSSYCVAAVHFMYFVCDTKFFCNDLILFNFVYD